MRFSTAVQTKEVKRSFVLAQQFTSKRMRSLRKKKRTEILTKNILARDFHAITKAVERLKESTLDRIISKEYPRRLRVYEKLHWFYGTVRTNEVGLWKGAGGIPVSYTRGSLAESAKKIRNELGQAESRIRMVRAMRTVPSIISAKSFIKKQKLLSPIIMEGGANSACRKGLKKMKGDIDDGCMRSLSFAVSGDKEIRAYIGLTTKTARHLGLE